MDGEKHGTQVWRSPNGEVYGTLGSAPKNRNRTLAFGAHGADQARQQDHQLGA